MTTRPADLVLIDAETLACVCPYHGPQIGAEYEPDRAPCGCEWFTDSAGRLRARAFSPEQQRALWESCNCAG
jgi:hypothetical protein